MKQIIDIIKEKIETGSHDINLANYNTHSSMPIAKWVGSLPEVGNVLTNGDQDITVTSHIVVGENVGVELDGGQMVDASQMIQMINDKICWIKEA